MASRDRPSDREIWRPIVGCLLGSKSEIWRPIVLGAPQSETGFNLAPHQEGLSTGSPVAGAPVGSGFRPVPEAVRSARHTWRLLGRDDVQFGHVGTSPRVREIASVCHDLSCSCPTSFASCHGGRRDIPALSPSGGQGCHVSRLRVSRLGARPEAVALGDVMKRLRDDVEIVGTLAPDPAASPPPWLTSPTRSPRRRSQDEAERNSMLSRALAGIAMADRGRARECGSSVGPTRTTTGVGGLATRSDERSGADTGLAITFRDRGAAESARPDDVARGSRKFLTAEFQVSFRSAGLDQQSFLRGS